MGTDTRLRRLKNVAQKSGRTLSPAEKSERAMHLLLNDVFWSECLAFGSAFAYSCGGSRYQPEDERERHGRELTYMEALKILDARTRLDLRYRHKRGDD